MDFESVEAAGPFRVRTAEPVVRWGQAVEAQLRWTALSVTSSTDQTGTLQHFEVLGDSGLGQRRCISEFDDASLSLCETLQNRPTGGVCKGCERAA